MSYRLGGRKEDEIHFRLESTQQTGHDMYNCTTKKELHDPSSSPKAAQRGGRQDHPNLDGPTWPDAGIDLL